MKSTFRLHQKQAVNISIMQDSLSVAEKKTDTKLPNSLGDKLCRVHLAINYAMGVGSGEHCGISIDKLMKKAGKLLKEFEKE